MLGNYLKTSSFNSKVNYGFLFLDMERFEFVKPAKGLENVLAEKMIVMNISTYGQIVISKEPIDLYDFKLFFSRK